jgi:hypothetical protein
MLQYKKGDDTLYCFFEGYEDRTYYAIRIENISNAEKYKDYICGGKDEVLKVHSLIKQNQHYKSVKTGFFIDKDFDSQAYSDEIYETPTYSIENLYCCKEAFEKILTSEFRLKPEDNDYTKCLSIYLNLQESFNQETFLLNAWLACQADYRNENGIKTRLNIDKRVKVYFDKIALPDLSGIKPFPEFSTKENIEIIFKDAQPIDQNKLQIKISEFQTLNLTERFRGKFLLRFLESFLCRLQSVFGTNSTLFEKKFSCSLRFEYATICSNLSQYAMTGNCLKQYIKKVS